MRVTAPGGDLPDIEQYFAIGIGVAHLHPGNRILHLNAKLLVQFALKRRQHWLARLAFTTGEFPLTALVGIDRTTRDEDLIAVKQQTDCDVYGIISCGTRH